MGAGAALVDYDNDGDLDVYPAAGPAARPDGAARSRLARTGCFATTSSKRKDARASPTSPPAADSVARRTAWASPRATTTTTATSISTSPRSGPNTLYRNNGDGTFTRRDRGTPVCATTAGARAATFVDYDRDGDLDLFVANYLDFSMTANKQCFDPGGARDYCGPRSYRPVPDRLFRNEGNGRFTDVSDAAGITKADGAGLGVATGDYNGDGWLDLYVANDATPNQLWIESRRTAPSTMTVRSQGWHSTPPAFPKAAWASPRATTTVMATRTCSSPTSSARPSRSTPTTAAAGSKTLESSRGWRSPTAAFTGFGTDWIDYDNDGWLDLFVANGAVNIVEALRGEPVPYRMRNLLFRNLGTGTFAETSSHGDAASIAQKSSRAAAFGDIDNDGDTDVLVTTNSGPVRLWLNRVGTRRSWLQVRLDNGDRNRLALGALVHVERAGERPLVRRVRTDGSYLAAQDPTLQFGLGDWRGSVTVRVDWPGGAREQWMLPRVNQRVTLSRGQGK